MRHIDLRSVTFAAALPALLLVAWFAYAPGLSGGFLFDDFGNLDALGAFGRVDDWPTFLRYITSGSADPTGRPVALLTFLIDAQNWPAESFPFKRTNVLLHLLNGSLLLLLLLRLSRVRGDSTPWIPLLATALWLLHPLFLSTTLYIVQREAMLPATFVLLGLLGYVAGRERARADRPSGVWIAAGSIVVFTTLAFFSKANGGLLPLLAWIAEAVLLRPAAPLNDVRTRRRFAFVVRALLILPSLIVALYLIHAGVADGLPSENGARPWTAWQRLLTETRVLLTYLGLLLVPRADSPGLFNDEVTISTSLLHPVTTLLCTLAISALLAAAWRWRRRFAPASFAVLFFFAGHLAESTVIPLELYFEHRNYLPSLPLFWPLARALLAPGPLSRLRRAVAPVTVAGFAAMLWLGAELWGDVARQRLVWAARNPDSPRAQAYAAQSDLERGASAASIVRLQHMLARHPDEIQLALNLVDAKCRAGKLSPADLAAAERALETAKNIGRLGYEWFDAVFPSSGRSCAAIDDGAYARLLAAAQRNPRITGAYGRRQEMLGLQARMALRRGDAAAALNLFDRALDADARPGVALTQAATLARAGQPRAALAHLDYFELTGRRRPPLRPDMPSLHRWLLWHDGYWDREFAHLRATLRGDLDAAAIPSRAVTE